MQSDSASLLGIFVPILVAHATEPVVLVVLAFGAFLFTITLQIFMAPYYLNLNKAVLIFFPPGLTSDVPAQSHVVQVIIDTLWYVHWLQMI